MKGLGVIGVGAMGSAIVRRIVESGVLAAGDVAVTDREPALAVRLSEELGVRAATAGELVQTVDAVLLAVKPHQVEELLQKLRAYLSTGQLLISIAAGITLGQLSRWTSNRQPVIRVMPNTPCLIGQGMSVMSVNECVNEEQLNWTRRLLAVTGRVLVLPESSMDAVTGLSGSGPAYTYLFLEALIDGGVTAGLSRKEATELAAQTVLGAAQMVLETETHPAVLKGMVTSPAGTTAAGLRVLEARAVRSAVIEAVLAATSRSRELGQDSDDT